MTDKQKEEIREVIMKDLETKLIPSLLSSYATGTHTDYDKWGRPQIEAIADYFIAKLDSLLTSQRDSLVEEIIEDYGYYNNGCGCCSNCDLEEKLRKEYNLIKQNK